MNIVDLLQRLSMSPRVYELSPKCCATVDALVAKDQVQDACLLSNCWTVLNENETCRTLVSTLDHIAQGHNGKLAAHTVYLLQECYKRAYEQIALICEKHDVPLPYDELNTEAIEYNYEKAKAIYDQFVAKEVHVEADGEKI